jgi:uncharacterized protein YciI
MRTFLPLSFCLPLLLLSGACSSPATDSGHSFAWVWILTGPEDATIEAEARAAAFAGHFANMGTLSEQGLLLLAGPFAPPLAQPDHRGIFVLNQADLEAARASAATDPAVQAGIFVLEVEAFRTDSPLAEIPARHAAFVAASQVENPPMDFHCRPYVLITGAPAADAERALAGAAIPVLMSGRFEDRDTALFCLDLKDGETAQKFIASLASPGVTWTVSPWYATEEVAQLRSLHGL